MIFDEERYCPICNTLRPFLVDDDTATCARCDYLDDSEFVDINEYWTEDENDCW